MASYSRWGGGTFVTLSPKPLNPNRREGMKQTREVNNPHTPTTLRALPTPITAGFRV